MSFTTRFTALATLLVAMLFAPLQALAAETVHLYLEADGIPIQGDSRVPGFEGEITLEGFTMESPAESGTGSRASSHRRILPVRFMKRIDQTSPLLFEALADQAKIDFAEIRYARTDARGETEIYFTIRLENGTVSSIESKSSDTANVETTEEIRITFHSVEWDHVDR